MCAQGSYEAKKKSRIAFKHSIESVLPQLDEIATRVMNGSHSPPTVDGNGTRYKFQMYDAKDKAAKKRAEKTKYIDLLGQ